MSPPIIHPTAHREELQRPIGSRPFYDRSGENGRLAADLVAVIQEMVKQPRLTRASDSKSAPTPDRKPAPKPKPEEPDPSPAFQIAGTASDHVTTSNPFQRSPPREGSYSPSIRISRAQPKANPRIKGAVDKGAIDKGDGNFQIHVNDEDVRQVLAMLGEAGKMNILPTANVTGKISLSLSGVSIEEALRAVLTSEGLVSRREGRFLFVGTPEEFAARERRKDKLGMRIYQPDYVSAMEIMSLLTPHLTPEVGKISVTTASKTGIGTDDAEAGGDSMTGSECVLVRDYESVLTGVMDHVVRAVDRRPLQVAIEAMILSVTLDDAHALGVDFQFLKNLGTIRFGMGSPGANLGSVTFEEGGLKLAFLDSSASAFIKALETIGDTNVISTPRLLTLNKQRAEILIGAELGYISTTVTETTSTQNVEFLEVGTQLRLRPFISRDGMIRMEIHPELSTGQVRIEGGLTLPDKQVTKVTTNVMVRDGSTVIIGGLIREDLTKSGRHIPFLGTLPILGPLFGFNDEKTERQEILVLVTPRIVHDYESHEEGDRGAGEFHRRQMVFADKMSPISRQYVARKYFRLAKEAWSAADRDRALKYINWSIHINPLNRAAIDLRTDIASGIPLGDHTLPAAPHPSAQDHMFYEDDSIDGRRVLPDFMHESANQPRKWSILPGMNARTAPQVSTRDHPRSAPQHRRRVTNKAARSNLRKRN